MNGVTSVVASAADTLGSALGGLNDKEREAVRLSGRPLGERSRTTIDLGDFTAQALSDEAQFALNVLEKGEGEHRAQGALLRTDDNTDFALSYDSEHSDLKPPGLDRLAFSAASQDSGKNVDW